MRKIELPVFLMVALDLNLYTWGWPRWVGSQVFATGSLPRRPRVTFLAVTTVLQSVEAAGPEDWAVSLKSPL